MSAEAQEPPERQLLTELRALLEQYPGLTPAQLASLRQLYSQARATEVMVLMSDPKLSKALRAIDPPADIGWDRALAWTAFLCAFALVVWLMLR